MKNTDILKAAFALWREHPTSGAYARDAQGEPVLIDSPSAVCWCATGAVLKIAANAENEQAAWAFVDRAAMRLFGAWGTYVNDYKLRSVMVYVWELAIQIAETEEAKESVA